ncbi:MAG: class II fructose-bisphosphate aldolase [Pyrinomonadaceae bacterium]
MIDGSRLSFSENCSLTRSVVELAAGVSVEGELVHVAHNEEESDITRFYTDPETAKQFVSETGVDALAVAVGTAHGFYRGKVRIDFDRLSRIRDSVGEAALVLHGGSGVSDELLARAIDSGIAKINFGTELKNAFTRALRSSLMASDFRNGTSHLPRTCGQRSTVIQRLDARMPLSLAWQLRATVEKAYESGSYWGPRAVQRTASQTHLA